MQKKTHILLGFFLLFLSTSSVLAWYDDSRVGSLTNKLNQLDDRIRSNGSKLDDLVSRVKRLEDRFEAEDSRIENLGVRISGMKSLEDRVKALETGGESGRSSSNGLKQKTKLPSIPGTA